MPVSITIRDVDDDVRNELAARAARSGRSLQSYLLDEITKLAQRPDMAAVLDAIAERKRRSPRAFSAEEILSWRDADRR